APAARPSPIDSRFNAGLALLEEGSGARYVIQLMMTDARDPDYLRAYLAEASRAIGPESLFLYPSGSAETPKVGVLYGAFKTRQEANQAMGSLPENLRQFRPYVRAVEAVRTDIRRTPSA
ncbi:MAG: SPOR domain-containing protein, partial [Burkholderiales bacterium]|nr:SPOR domain-containing protein [Burkholderiales bacterium]